MRFQRQISKYILVREWHCVSGKTHTVSSTVTFPSWGVSARGNPIVILTFACRIRETLLTMEDLATSAFHPLMASPSRVSSVHLENKKIREPPKL